MLHPLGDNMMKLMRETTGAGQGLKTDILEAQASLEFVYDATPNSPQDS